MKGSVVTVPANKAPHTPTATVVWFDPGESTGVCVLAVNPAWLEGNWDADWAGLKTATRSAWFSQIGAEPREWDGYRAVTPARENRVPERFYNGPALSERVGQELSMIYQAREVLDLWPSAAWGYETYRVESMAAATTEALTPVRFFSTLAFSTIMDDGRPRVPFVSDRSMKASASDDRLKRAGLYVPGMPHATDAARHAALFMRSARQHRAIRQAAWPRLFGQPHLFGESK